MTLLKSICKKEGCACETLLDSSADNPDILIIGGSPGVDDVKSGKSFTGKRGLVLRKCLKELSKKYSFTYAITNTIRKRGVANDFCIKALKHDIKRLNPKIIVCLGKSTYKLFNSSQHFPNFFMMEEGCVRQLEVFGETRAVIAAIHPKWCFENDPCSVGFLYTALHKAVLYTTQGTDFNISNDFTYKVIETIDELKEMVETMRKSKNKVGIDTETTSLNRVYDATVLSIQFCNDGKHGYVLPYKHFDSPFSNKDLKKINKILVDFLTGETQVTGYIFQNAKFDMHQLFRELHVLIYNAPIIDTMFNEYLLEENWSRATGYFPKGSGPYSLGTISYKRGFTCYVTEQEMDKKKRTRLKDVPIKDFARYAAADAIVVWNIYKKQLLLAKHSDYEKQFKKMALIFNTHMTRVLVYMEHCGMPINIEVLRELSNPRTSKLIGLIKAVGTKFKEMDSVQKLEKILIKQETGSHTTLFGKPDLFDIQKKSHQELLFTKILKLDPLKEGGKTSVDADFQKTYKDVPEVKLLTQWNKLGKLKSSYIDSIMHFMTKENKEADFFTDLRVRAQYMFDAVTGRLKSARPNQQQRPSHGENIDFVLSLYEASPNKMLVKLDQSTFEVRGLGFISKDKALCNSFIEMHDLKTKWRNDTSIMPKEELKNLTDSHKRNASIFFDTPVGKVTSDMRQDTKNFVFGCFTSDTIVSTEEGPIRIGKLSKLEKNIKVITQKGVFSSKGSEFMGVKPIVSVMTRQAHLKGTSGHWILTVSKDCKLEMKPLGSLKIDDAVLYQRGSFGSLIPKIKDSEVSLLDIEAMGLFTADGSANFYGNGVYRVHHCSGDKKEVNLFRKFIYRNCGIKAPLVPHVPPKIKGQKSESQLMYYVQINNKELYTKLKKFGLLGNQHVRRVPQKVLQSPKEYISAYLRGYFQGDGGLRFNNDTRAQISATSVNPDLLFDICYLLNLFGISSHVYETSMAYEIVITSSSSILVYAKEIGFITEDKKEKLLYLLSKIDKFSKMPIDKTNLPIDFSKLRKIYAEKAEVTTFRSRKIYYKGIHIPPLPAKIPDLLPIIKEYKEAFTILDLKEEYKCLSLVSKENIKVSKVFQGPVDFGKKKVYDVINVEKVHTWSANGIVVHNTMYGMGDNSIAANLGKTLKQAQAVKKLFFKNMPEAAKWLFDYIINFAKKHLFVQSPIGRKRRLWGHLLPKGAATAKMDRLAMNSIIQGFCSDLNIIATSLLIGYIYKWGIGKYQVPDEEALMVINLVHDSCEMEVPKSFFKKIYKIEKIFTSIVVEYVKENFGFSIDIPLEIDMEIGKRFSEMSKWDGSKESLRLIKDKMKNL